MKPSLTFATQGVNGNQSPLSSTMRIAPDSRNHRKPSRVLSIQLARERPIIVSAIKSHERSGSSETLIKSFPVLEPSNNFWSAVGALSSPATTSSRYLILPCKYH